MATVLEFLEKTMGGEAAPKETPPEPVIKVARDDPNYIAWLEGERQRLLKSRLRGGMADEPIPAEAEAYEGSNDLYYSLKKSVGVWETVLTPGKDEKGRDMANRGMALGMALVEKMKKGEIEDMDALSLMMSLNPVLCQPFTGTGQMAWVYQQMAQQGRDVE